MLKIIITLTLLSSSLFSMNTCKQTILDFYNEIGVPLKKDAFDSTTFKELKLTTKQFNALKTEEQMKYFKKLMPTSMVAKRTLPYIEALRKKITDLISTLYLDVANNFPKINNLLDKDYTLIEYHKQITKCI